VSRLYTKTRYSLWDSCGRVNRDFYTQRRSTDGRTLDELSARRRDRYLTTRNTQNNIILAGFEPTVSTGERPQTYALDRASVGISRLPVIKCSILLMDADSYSKMQGNIHQTTWFPVP